LFLEEKRVTAHGGFSPHVPPQSTEQKPTSKAQKMARTEAEIKAIRQAAAKNASETTMARNTALIKFAVKQLQEKKKEVTAASVAKLAGMSDSTARDYLQKMGILKERVVMTAEQKAMEKRLAIQLRVLILAGNKVGLAVSTKNAEGKDNWNMAT
jgi:hypothetical protein